MPVITRHCVNCEQPRTVLAANHAHADQQLVAAGWHWVDDHHTQLACPACTAADPGVAPHISTAEWVAAHPEAHGHLLVRGTSADHITARAWAALAAHWPPCGEVVLDTVRTGCWRTERCHCRTTVAGRAAHPAWHYLPADPDDPTAFPGAEIRLYHPLGKSS